MLKVFLVEDESVIRDGIRERIPWEQYGYQFVGEAGDGEMALPLIRKNRPDVLITDIKMPFMDGLSLSKVVREEFPKMKIVILSGYDDFEYARQAIRAGVDQYLLKPVTRMDMKKTLLELKEKIQQEMEQEDYQAQFQSDMHIYEQFNRRRFMEKMLEGSLSVKEIYEEAARQSLEITASCYNLLFFYLSEKKGSSLEKDMFAFIRQQDEVLHFFLKFPQYILFRWNADCYGVLIKGEKDQISGYTAEGVEHIQKVCRREEENLDWYVAVGNPVERLSMLSVCYQDINHYFAYRFLAPDLHILTGDTLEDYLNTQESNKSIESVDPAKMAQEIIRDFLDKGSPMEIHDFVASYLASIQEALKSRMFRAYVVLNIRFTVIAYIESLGVEKEEYMEKIKDGSQDMKTELSQLPQYFIEMLETALDFRDRENNNRNKKILRKALSYIDENYASENLSLNTVAGEVGVSANYLSAVFSQTMEKTFVEYVTGKKMEKAKKLLRSTGKSAGEIAQEVGYKDSHYFSFVFKKTQGCSPREYRAGKKSQSQ